MTVPANTLQRPLKHTISSTCMRIIGDNFVSLYPVTNSSN